MKRSRFIPIILAFAVLISMGAVSAGWVYLLNAPNLGHGISDVEANHFIYIEGDEEMVTAESVFVENFIQHINDPTSPIHTYIEERKDKGSFFYPINELAINDPEADGIKELLGLTDFPEITAMIKFTSGSSAYELYSTRVDVYEKDENGSYVIPDASFEDETTFIYPVNRTSLKVVDGKYVADSVSYGYSRTIYYYETPTSQSDVRTFDVSMWAEGASADTALTIETGIVDKEITVMNTEENKEVWLTFTPTARNQTYSFVGVNCYATVYNRNGNAVSNSMTRNNTYYIRVQYSYVGEPQNLRFTIQTN